MKIIFPFWLTNFVYLHYLCSRNNNFMYNTKKIKIMEENKKNALSEEQLKEIAGELENIKIIMRV